MFAECSGSITGLLFEHFGKIIDIRKSGGRGDLVNAKVGVPGQQLFGLADTFIGDV